MLLLLYRGDGVVGEEGKGAGRVGRGRGAASFQRMRLRAGL